ncbi:MAG: THUMP domain-containing protein [Sutterellaceae bacterium]|nr:THUMP domain-containing protein [Burkholderiaceae bacterium]MDW8429463.1 THUMP domain-containing protein [Sutterellaceae bacterium]
MIAAAERFFAVCPRGLEALLAQELTALGAQACTPQAGGVAFAGTLETGYAANLHSRLASRVLREVCQAPCANEDDLYAAAHAVAWERWFDARQTLRVDVTLAGSQRSNAGFLTLRVKDAIVDRLRARTGARPCIDRARPDVRVFAHLDGRVAYLYLDLSGEALFKRGWRADKAEAPLKENLAAGLLALAGWDPSQPLLDPFCGSGTIALEAAAIAARRAPGLQRRFAFERLRDFDAACWQQLLAQAQEQAQHAAGAAVKIAASDAAPRAIETARRNASLAGFEPWLADGRLQFAVADARTVAPPAAAGLIVTNPPYGVQSQPGDSDLPTLMRQFAAHLKRHFGGWTAWLLSADLDLPKHMRLRETRRIVLFNGPLACRLFRFELRAGSYRRAVAGARLS